MGEEDSAHLWILVLSLVDYGLEGKVYIIECSEIADLKLNVDRLSDRFQYRGSCVCRKEEEKWPNVKFVVIRRIVRQSRAVSTPQWAGN